MRHPVYREADRLRGIGKHEAETRIPLKLMDIAKISRAQVVEAYYIMPLRHEAIA